MAMKKEIKLILIDDHQLFLEGAQLLLSQEDEFNIIGAYTNPSHALKQLDHIVPDIIITDISMPIMNGLELIKIVKKIYPIKILVVSSYQNIIPFYLIDGYLTKNFSPVDLVKAIKKIVFENNKVFFYEDSKEQLFLEFKKHILTKREKEIVSLISNEFTLHEIAETLFISKHTVESHKKNIYSKLKVKSSAGLIKKCLCLGLLN